jgi:hypothetical protein
MATIIAAMRAQMHATRSVTGFLEMSAGNTKSGRLSFLRRGTLRVKMTAGRMKPTKG